MQKKFSSLFLGNLSFEYSSLHTCLSKIRKEMLQIYLFLYDLGVSKIFLFFQLSVCVYQTPLLWAWFDTRSVCKAEFKWFELRGFLLLGCNTKVEEPSLSYYWPIAGGRIMGYISFPRVLVICKMQVTLFGIWTWTAVSISYNSNHYTMNTSFLISLMSDNSKKSFLKNTWI